LRETVAHVLHRPHRNPKVSALLVLTTLPSADLARELADQLVRERIAACVSVLPDVHSTYRWQDTIETSAESLLLIKTTDDAYPELQTWLQNRHPYELPEIIAVAIADGLPAYLAWISTNTAPQ
jgi:periplasmic divalent cation tolerance protein